MVNDVHLGAGCDGALQHCQYLAAGPINFDFDVGILLHEILGGLVEQLLQGLALAEHAPVDDLDLLRRLLRGLLLDCWLLSRRCLSSGSALRRYKR